MSRVVVNEIEAKVGNDITFNNIVKIDTLKGKTTAGSVTVQGEGSATTNLQSGLTKMHSVVDQSSTQAITDSFNLSSISDGGTAKTTKTMTNAMSNITYTISGSCETTSSGHGAVHNEDIGVTRTTTAFGLYIIRNDGSLSDTVVMTAIHGDLA